MIILIFSKILNGLKVCLFCINIIVKIILFLVIGYYITIKVYHYVGWRLGFISHNSSLHPINKRYIISIIGRRENLRLKG